MSRYKARIQAFELLFSASFVKSKIDLKKVFNNFEFEYDQKIDEFASRVFWGVSENLQKIDELIKSNLKNWEVNRISRVALCTMRIAVYEMLFESEIPAGISSYEAVEIAKRYGSSEEPAYVNAVLNAIEKEILTSTN
ncbi:MAG: transcription antitermination factor NusB [Oscillospiraceae bacterium]|nr:transcription antitermination factor NusB [Oscillospiraceae bacterium]